MEAIAVSIDGNVEVDIYNSPWAPASIDETETVPPLSALRPLEFAAKERLSDALFSPKDPESKKRDYELLSKRLQQKHDALERELRVSFFVCFFFWKMGV